MEQEETYPFAPEYDTYMVNIMLRHVKPIITDIRNIVMIKNTKRLVQKIEGNEKKEINK